MTPYMKIRTSFHTPIHSFFLNDGKDAFIHVVTVSHNGDIALHLNTLQSYSTEVLP